MYCSAISAGYTRYLWHRAADAIRSDGERNPIGRRTESDRVADAIRWQRGHFQGALLGGALVSSAPTKQTGREFPQNTRNTQNLLAEKCLPQIDTDTHRLGGYGIPAIPTPPITQPNHLWKSVKSVGEYYHAGAAASAAPTKQTERVFPQNTRNTQNLLAEKCLPQIGTDTHRLGGYGILPYPRRQ